MQGAKEFINTAIAFALDIGGARAHPSSGFPLSGSGTLLFIGRVGRALAFWKRNRNGAAYSEVQSNLLAALPYARGPEDVAALPGRLVKCGEMARVVGCPAFGASRHLLTVLIPALELDPGVGAVMNIKYSDEIIEVCRRLELTVASFERQDEPEDFAAQPQTVIGNGVLWLPWRN